MAYQGDIPLSEPLFSIVIACYKQEAFVRESVESALAQGYLHYEVIVVDDASPDGTADVLRTFGDAILFSGLTVNGGACAARNHGASLAMGKYLVFLDGDDVLMPWSLDVYRRIIDACSPRLILGRSALFHGSVPALTTADLPHEIRFVEYENFLSKDRPWVYNTSSLVVERAAFNSTDGWSKEIFHQDIQDLLNKLGVTGKTALLLGPNTVWYRMHATNAIRSVSRFLQGIDILWAKARSGSYPGGRRQEVKRTAWFGGLILYWFKEAFRTGLYREGLTLLASKGWMILWAVIWRSKSWIAGRENVKILRLGKNDPAKGFVEIHSR